MVDMKAGVSTTRNDFLAESWMLRAGTAMRLETWGGLLYSYSSRKLATLRDPQLAGLVKSLDGESTLSQMLAQSTGAIDPARLRETVHSLELAGFIQRTHAPAEPVAASNESPPPAMEAVPLSRVSVENMQRGLSAPICLTWEWTYACNLSCRHCLSASGTRDDRELSTVECERVIDELQAMQVFYVNVGGGEPTVRNDFWYLLDYAVAHGVGVKFSTNGIRLNPERARRLAATDYVDVQISLDGATREVNDRVRGRGSYNSALRALENLAAADFVAPKISVVVTRENVSQLDDFKALATRYNAVLRLTRLRPAGRGVDVWDELRLLPDQQRRLYDWLRAEGGGVMTGDSFFHLSAYGDRLPGMNLCGAGRVVCLIDPIGDVYACPFAMHARFRAGNTRDAGFGAVWRDAPLFSQLRGPQPASVCQSCDAFDACRGGCMAAKFFTGRRLEDPDPECVLGHSVEPSLKPPALGIGHSRQSAVRRGVVDLGLPRKLCDTDPLDVGFAG